MDYAIAIAACCAVVGFMIVIVIFSIACKKRNQCRSDEKRKVSDTSEKENSNNKTKLFWSRFATRPNENVVTIKVGQSGGSQPRPMPRVYELPDVQ